MGRISLIDAAGYLLMLSGGMHLVAWAVGGFVYGLYGLLPLGVVLLALGFFLQRTEWRWLGYLAYLGVGIGASAAIREAFIAVGTPNWWYVLILIVDALAVIALFGFLWRSPAAKRA